MSLYQPTITECAPPEKPLQGYRICFLLPSDDMAQMRSPEGKSITTKVGDTSCKLVPKGASISGLGYCSQETPKQFFQRVMGSHPTLLIAVAGPDNSVNELLENGLYQQAMCPLLFLFPETFTDSILMDALLSEGAIVQMYKKPEDIPDLIHQYLLPYGQLEIYC